MIKPKNLQTVEVSTRILLSDVNTFGSCFKENIKSSMLTSTQSQSERKLSKISYQGLMGERF